MVSEVNYKHYVFDNLVTEYLNGKTKILSRMDMWSKSNLRIDYSQMALLSKLNSKLFEGYLDNNFFLFFKEMKDKISFEIDFPGDVLNSIIELRMNIKNLNSEHLEHIYSKFKEYGCEEYPHYQFLTMEPEDPEEVCLGKVYTTLINQPDMYEFENSSIQMTFY